jgi:hypothetical protein
MSDEAISGQLLQYGHTVVGTTAVRLCHSFKAYSGVLVRCPLVAEYEGVQNTVAVFIGGPAVTADTSSTGGMPILPGSSVVIPIADPSELWVIASAPAQDVAWMGV